MTNKKARIKLTLKRGHGYIIVAWSSVLFGMDLNVYIV